MRGRKGKLGVISGAYVQKKQDKDLKEPSKHQKKKKKAHAL